MVRERRRVHLFQRRHSHPLLLSIENCKAYVDLIQQVVPLAANEAHGLVATHHLSFRASWLLSSKTPAAVSGRNEVELTLAQRPSQARSSSSSLLLPPSLSFSTSCCRRSLLPPFPQGDRSTRERTAFGVQVSSRCMWRRSVEQTSL